MNKKLVLYSHSVNSSFVRKDLVLLEREYNVKKFFFDPKRKWLVPYQFICQLFFLLINLRSSSLLITQFGGYQSFLPSLLGKVFSRPSLIILGGSDCVSFPSINYGNFNRPLLKTLTRWSYEMVTHLSPVHKSLVRSKYTYTDDDYPEQGYEVFCPKVTAEYTELHYGYDHNLFTFGKERIPNSFITVGYLNSANYYRKGIDLIIELAIRQPILKFTIVGGGIDDIPVDDVPKNVQFLKSVSYEELTALYASHEYYFQLSLCEGFPSAICEAMLCGCIPIGSDVAAISEIIGDTGFVLSYKSSNHLDGLIEKALQIDKTKGALSARHRIIEKYPINEREKLLTLCARIIKEGVKKKKI